MIHTLNSIVSVSGLLTKNVNPCSYTGRSVRNFATVV